MSGGFQVEPGELTGVAATLGAAADLFQSASSGLDGGAGDLGLPELSAAAESFGAGWQGLMGRLSDVAEQLSGAVSAAGRQYLDMDAGASRLLGADR